MFFYNFSYFLGGFDIGEENIVDQITEEELEETVGGTSDLVDAVLARGTGTSLGLENGAGGF